MGHHFQGISNLPPTRSTNLGNETMRSRQACQQYLETMEQIHLSMMEPHASNKNADMATVCPMPGMKDVPAWLKSLRLHKYTGIFMQLSYEQMLNLNDQQLEVMKVTTGARRKILHSVEKLKKRAELMRSVLSSLNPDSDNRCVRCAIGYLRNVLTTPMRRFDPNQKIGFGYVERENIPELCMHVLNRVFSMVFGRDPIADVTNDYVLMMYTILDRINGNEAFPEYYQLRAMQLKKILRKRVSIHDLRRFNLAMPPHGKCQSCATQEAAISTFMTAFQREHQQHQDKVFQQLLRNNRYQIMAEKYIRENRVSKTAQQPQRPPPPPGQPAVPLMSLDPNCICHGSTVAHNKVYNNHDVHSLMESTPMFPDEARVLSYPQYQSSNLRQDSRPVQQQWARNYLMEYANQIQRPSPIQRPQPEPVSNPWSPITTQRSDSGETSGYSSASSDRGSGAGSPRANAASAVETDLSELLSQMNFQPLWTMN